MLNRAKAIRDQLGLLHSGKGAWLLGVLAKVLRLLPNALYDRLLSKRARKKRDDDEAPREKPARKARAKNEGRQQRGDDGGSVPAGEWNGPRPGFLDISAT